MQALRGKLPGSWMLRDFTLPRVESPTTPVGTRCIFTRMGFPPLRLLGERQLLV